MFLLECDLIVTLAKNLTILLGKTRALNEWENARLRVT